MNAEFVYSAGLADQLRPCSKPEVVFSGRSNVGKSSLINKLTQRKALARVSSKPGKTATINFFDCGSYSLVDLPGYGYAKVSKAEKLRWAELVEGYFAADRDIRLVVQIVDMRHLLSADDMNMVAYLYENEIPFIIVMTKQDKLNVSEQQKMYDAISAQLSDFEGVRLFPFSALKGTGAEAIQTAITDSIE